MLISRRNLLIHIIVSYVWAAFRDPGRDPLDSSSCQFFFSRVPKTENSSLSKGEWEAYFLANLSFSSHMFLLAAPLRMGTHYLDNLPNAGDHRVHNNATFCECNHGAAMMPGTKRNVWPSAWKHGRFPPNSQTSSRSIQTCVHAGRGRHPDRVSTARDYPLVGNSRPLPCYWPRLRCSNRMGPAEVDCRGTVVRPGASDSLIDGGEFLF